MTKTALEDPAPVSEARPVRAVTTRNTERAIVAAPQSWRDPGWSRELTSDIAGAHLLRDHLGVVFAPRTLTIVLTPHWSTATAIGPAILPASGVRPRFLTWGLVGVEAVHDVSMPPGVIEAALVSLQSASADRRAAMAFKVLAAQ